VLVVGGVFIVLILGAFIAVVVFKKKPISSPNISPVSVTSDSEKDWCLQFIKKGTELTSQEFPAFGFQEMDAAQQEEYTKNKTLEVENIFEKEVQRAKEGGVLLTKSDLCAHSLATFDLLGKNKNLPAVSNEPSVNPYEVRSGDLEKYLDPERTKVVIAWFGRNAQEGRVKGLVQASRRNIVDRCIYDSHNRILPPQSGGRECEYADPAYNGTAKDDFWGKLEEFGGTWGGCDFMVTRDSTGAVSDFRYCATLPSGKVMTCTKSDIYCSFPGLSD
jgi:hypothetical protein